MLFQDQSERCTALALLLQSEEEVGEGVLVGDAKRRRRGDAEKGGSVRAKGGTGSEWSLEVANRTETETGLKWLRLQVVLGLDLFGWETIGGMESGLDALGARSWWEAS